MGRTPYSLSMDSKVIFLDFDLFFRILNVMRQVEQVRGQQFPFHKLISGLILITNSG